MEGSDVSGKKGFHISQQDCIDFSKVSGDYNPVHLDEVQASDFVKSNFPSVMEKNPEQFKESLICPGMMQILRVIESLRSDKFAFPTSYDVKFRGFVNIPREGLDVEAEYRVTSETDSQSNLEFTLSGPESAKYIKSAIVSFTRARYWDLDRSKVKDNYALCVAEKKDGSFSTGEVELPFKKTGYFAIRRISLKQDLDARPVYDYIINMQSIVGDNNVRSLIPLIYSAKIPGELQKVWVERNDGADLNQLGMMYASQSCAFSNNQRMLKELQNAGAVDLGVVFYSQKSRFGFVTHELHVAAVTPVRRTPVFAGVSTVVVIEKKD